MLNRLRGALAPSLERIGTAFAATHLPPSFWTWTALVLALLSALAYWRGAEYAALAGGAVLLASGFFDVMDGQVARITNKTTRAGAFLDSSFDKIAEVAVFFGIMAGGLAEPHLVFLAVTLSLLVSYTRARAESLGIKLQGIGIGERAERLLVLAIIGMIGFVEWAVIIVSIIAAVTLVQRIIYSLRAAKP